MIQEDFAFFIFSVIQESECVKLMIVKYKAF